MALKRTLEVAESGHFDVDTDPENANDENKKPTSPKRKRVKTGSDGTVDDSTRKRKRDFFEQKDPMDEDQSDANFDSKHPRISTPDSVHTIDIFRDSAEVRDHSSDSSNSDTLIDSWPLAIITPTNIGYRSLRSPDSMSPGQNTPDEDSSPSYSMIEEDSISWIRKRTAYGVVLVPQNGDDDSEYLTTDDEDVENQPPVEDAVSWNEREEKVFLALVCDFGHNWERIQVHLPGKSASDVSYHGNVTQEPS